jgi:nitroreductase/NAD-dependent dihydropyrimidine dehydrogenase PreA subunit
MRIRTDLCTGCGLCVSVCKDFGLKLENGKAVRAERPLFGCCACGHCMAVCPSGAIEVSGRTLSPLDLFPLPGREQSAAYAPLLNLLQRRRSIREFTDKPVAAEDVDKILAAASTAPMGLPPSDVNVLVLDGKERVRAFSKDYCTYLEKIRWIVSDWFLLLMRPFWGRATDELFRNFVRPLFRIYTENMRKSVDVVTYDAPLALYFYGSAYADPADPIVAATTAMLAAESLGLGTCMLGGIHPLIQMGRKAKAFREKHGVRCASREGVFVIMGHPAMTYAKGIRRTFASVEISR